MSTNTSPRRAVFVGGCGRSGTTMLGDRLGAHAAHVVTPETSFKNQLVRQGWAGSDGDLARGLELLARHPKFRDLGVELPALDTPTLAALFDAVLPRYAQSRGKPDDAVWIDHTPSNLGIALYLLEQFPHSHAIHLVRDGRAVAASTIPLDWGPNSVIAVAREWTLYVGLGLALEARFPDRVHRVRYEELIGEPEATLRRLCTRIGLTFDRSMLDGGGLAIPSRQSGQFALVGKPPDPTRAIAWKSTLAHRQIEIFEAETSALLPLLGYELMFDGRTRNVSPIDSLLIDARDVIRDRTFNRYRRWRRGA